MQQKFSGTPYCRIGVPLVKRWRRRDEWTELAACGGSDAHTAESPDAEMLAEAKRICDGCPVRPECIEWALDEAACSVFVAGIYLPDPKYKRELKVLYSHLASSLTRERELRGTDI